MSCFLRYNTIRKDGAVIHEYNGAACFGNIWHDGMSGNWGVIYWPTINTSPEEAIQFLEDMKAIGFEIDDPKAIVEGKGYTIFTDLGKSAAWFFGNLTVVRMLDEFTRVVYNYLELKKLMPEADKFQLLQLAHYTHLKRGEFYGMGHSLINSIAGFPGGYKTWQRVLDARSSGSRKVHQMFSGRSRMVHSDEEQLSLKNPRDVRRLHARLSGDPKFADEKPTEDLHRQPAVLSDALSGPVPAG